MLRESLVLLGSEWKVAVDNELKQLKQSDGMLLGNLAAIFVRSDYFLGKPEEDCNMQNTTYLAVFYPSKYSVVCGKTFTSMANKGSKWRLMSLSEFIDQVFEFNFTYLQMLYNNSSWFETGDIKRLRDKVSRDLENEYNKGKFIHKQVAMACNVLRSINEGRFKEDNILKDRVFLVLKALQSVDIIKSTFKVGVSTSLDAEEYRRYITDAVVDGEINSEVLKELNIKAAKYSESITRAVQDKESYKVHKLEEKYYFLKNTVASILD